MLALIIIVALLCRLDASQNQWVWEKWSDYNRLYGNIDMAEFMQNHCLFVIADRIYHREETKFNLTALFVEMSQRREVDLCRRMTNDNILDFTVLSSKRKA